MNANRLHPRIQVLGILFCTLLAFLIGAGCGKKKHEVRITVEDQDGQPIEGVLVEAVAGDLELGRTDADGRVEVKIARPKEGPLLVHLKLDQQSEEHYRLENPYEIDDSDLIRRFKPITVFRKPDPGGGATVTLQTVPAGAEVYIDDELEGTTPLTLKDQPLRRLLIEYRLEGYHPLTMEAILLPGVRTEIDTLQPIAVTTGALFVDSNPQEASISLDGRPTGRSTPTAFEDLALGQHTVRLQKSGYQTVTERIVINPGHRSYLSPLLPRGDQEPPPSPPTAARIKYFVRTAPRYAEIYVDGDRTKNWNAEGFGFDITLKEGEHSFQAINERAGVYRTFKYHVKLGDKNKKLILNYETGEVTAVLN